MIGSSTRPDAAEIPEDKPPDWANSMMKWALNTRGIQAAVGKGVALLTFTGRRTGKSYTIPVGYHRQGDTVTIVTKRTRTWWRNFETPTQVELRLAGKRWIGKAELMTGDDGVVQFMCDYLAKRPIDAKAFGLKKDEITEERIRLLVPQIVLVRIDISPGE